jgi:exosortase/archaeosortase family protein
LWQKWEHDSDFRYNVTRFVAIIVVVGTALAILVSLDPEIPLVQRATADQVTMVLNAVGVPAQSYWLWVDVPERIITPAEKAEITMALSRLGLSTAEERGYLIGRGQIQSWAQQDSVRDYALSLRARGLETDIQPAVIVTSAVAVKVIPACSAWVGMAAIAALILAFPGGTKKGKLYGLLLAFVGLYLLNIVRLASTIALTNWLGPNVFDLMHIFLWREAMVGIALCGWVAWLHWLANAE